MKMTPSNRRLVIVSHSLLPTLVYGLGLILVTPLVDGIEWLAIARQRGTSWNSTLDCSTASSLTRPPLQMTATQSHPVYDVMTSPSSSSSIDERALLNRLQTRLCVESLDLMPAVVQSAHDTALVCQQLFYHYRWNCSSILLAPDFASDLKIGTREQAFVYALSSASLSRSVAKACSTGASTSCTCGRRDRQSSVVRGIDAQDHASSYSSSAQLQQQPQQAFRFGGCDDDVSFGVRFGEAFGDRGRSELQQQTTTEREKAVDRFLSMVNKHNSNAGHQSLVDSMIVSCKCHGVSGSCSVKTCWNAVPELNAVGTSLMQAYVRAVRLAVSSTAIGTKRRAGRDLSSQRGRVQGQRQGQGRRQRELPIDRKHLVYFSSSPDYCVADLAAGSYGTRHRICRSNIVTSFSGASTSDQGSCDVMCCGRGYTSEVVQLVHRCHCKYVWCCHVKCKNCTSTAVVNRCR